MMSVNIRNGRNLMTGVLIGKKKKREREREATKNHMPTNWTT